MPNTLLDVKHIKKYFPIRKGILNKIVGYGKPVDDISFTINEGESFGCTGDSGSGKTVLVYCLAALYKLTEGNLSFMGKDLCEFNSGQLKTARKNFQVIFQNPILSLPPKMTVEKILEEPLIIQKYSDKKGRRRKLIEILKEVGLQENHLNRFPSQLSGGQQQRIGIARAFILEPKLVLCDEPVSALDVSLQAQVLNLFDKLNKKTTYFIASSNISVIRRICKTTAVMYLGKFVEVAPTEELCQKPYHPYSKVLVDSIPDMREELKASNTQVEIPKVDFPTIWDMPDGCPYNLLCERSNKICHNEYPSLTELTPGRLVACHHPLLELFSQNREQ